MFVVVTHSAYGKLHMCRAGLVFPKKPLFRVAPLEHPCTSVDAAGLALCHLKFTLGNIAYIHLTLDQT